MKNDEGKRTEDTGLTNHEELKIERHERISELVDDLLESEAKLSNKIIMADNRKTNIDDFAELSFNKQSTQRAISALEEIIFAEGATEMNILALKKTLGIKADDIIDYSGLSYGVEVKGSKIVIGNRKNETSKTVLSRVLPSIKNDRKKLAVWRKMSVNDRRETIVKACFDLIIQHIDRLQFLTQNVLKTPNVKD